MADSEGLEQSMGMNEILYKVLVVGNFGVGKRNARTAQDTCNIYEIIFIYLYIRTNPKSSIVYKGFFVFFLVYFQGKYNETNDWCIFIYI